MWLKFRNGVPPYPFKSNSYYMVRFCYNLKHNTLICLTIIEIKIVKFFIYGANLPKFETQHFHKFNNSKLYQNLELEVHRRPPLQKRHSYLYVPILLKFENEHFHMFTNNNWDWNLKMEASSSPLPLRLSKKSIDHCY